MFSLFMHLPLKLFKFVIAFRFNVNSLYYNHCDSNLDLRMAIFGKLSINYMFYKQKVNKFALAGLPL